MKVERFHFRTSRFISHFYFSFDFHFVRLPVDHSLHPRPARSRSMPSSISMRGTSATIVSGPQTKQSVAGSSMSGASCDGLMRPRSPCQVSGASRVDVQAQLQAVVPARHRAELGQIGEVVGGLGAVEQPHPARLSREQRLSNHRPDRGDARAAGDEQEVALRRLDGKHERADRSLNAHAAHRARPRRTGVPIARTARP